MRPGGGYRLLERPGRVLNRAVFIGSDKKRRAIVVKTVARRFAWRGFNMPRLLSQNDFVSNSYHFAYAFIRASLKGGKFLVKYPLVAFDLSRMLLNL